MFTINNLTVKCGRVVIINNLTLSLNTSSINGVVGYNGSGKTTLLNAIYGLVNCETGQIMCNDKILNRSQVAYLEASNFFYSNITGRDYLKLFQKHNTNFNIELWQSIFTLPLDQLVVTYSTGMKKKLALLGVLSLDKELVILDEPFNGLDIESVAVLQIICKKLVEKQKTIIVTSHIIETLTSMCDSISILKDGVMSSTFTP